MLFTNLIVVRNLHNKFQPYSVNRSRENQVSLDNMSDGQSDGHFFFNFQVFKNFFLAVFREKYTKLVIAPRPDSIQFSY